MTVAELRVDLDTFDANLDAVRARVEPARLMLVVKDDAYGHGLEHIVRRAAAAGVEWFGAFDMREALIARAAAGPRARIFSWLAVPAGEIRAAIAADIDLGVGDLRYLDEVARTAREVGESARVHLKIDTGLHRNGIRPEDWDAAVQHARSLESAGLVRVIGVWSHIAEASDEEDDAARAAFETAVAAAEGAGLQVEVRHLSASAASFARAEFRYDLVRVGAFCYGIRSAGGPDEASLGIRPIAALVAPVTHVADHAVTIGIGALDGLPSTLAMRSAVTVAANEGQRVGVQHIDLAHTAVAPWPHAQPGDEVIVFGPEGSSATDLAEAIGTVGEEILVRVSPHVKRVYRGA
jgi:alanine racemase